MRNCIVLLLFVLAGISSEAFFSLDAATRTARNRETVENALPVNWVRTVDGWEPDSYLFSQPIDESPSLHPAIVAAGQLLASAFALLAFSPSSDNEEA